ncbi:MAG: hypothetical protein ABW124_15930 [Candidatus Thiodiazotropha sp. 6PLUC9]
MKRSGIRDNLAPCGGTRWPDNALNIYYHIKVTKKHSMTQLCSLDEAKRNPG